MTATPWLGEAACLFAALMWAVAVTLFRPAVEQYDPWTVNLGRSVIAALLLGASTVAMGESRTLLAAPPAALAVVAVSGVVGLALGDTALFAAVGRIGVHRTLLFQTLGPVFAAALSIGFYGEKAGLGRLAGVAVILAGVFLVVSAERSRSAADAEGADVLGYSLAALAALGQGAGVVLAKDGLDEMPLVAASFLRLAAGALAMTVVVGLLGRLGPVTSALLRPRTLSRLAAPTLLGNYVSFLLLMAGVALAPASVAAVLLATSPVFSFFLDHYLAGTPITARGLGGTLLAVAGVGVLALAG